jgi:glycosyltransferase involved in cell wall biosynthesis
MEPAPPHENPHITFIIPIRHQLNAKNWSELRANLTQTVKSIANQDFDGWRAIIVANHGADLPPLPPGFTVERVDFPPNRLHEQGNADKQSFYDAFRIDKGRRVLAGMLRAKPSDYFMIVDDDDFVSNRLSRFVAENEGENGWYIREGYVWRSNARITYLHQDFANSCGTSHIVRADLYELPGKLEHYSDDNIKNMLGSHVFIAKYLKERGAPLAPLPFPGAVYRIGHVGAHSRSRGLIRTFLFNRANLKSLVSAIKSVMQFRRLTSAIREDFCLPARKIT